MLCRPCYRGHELKGSGPISCAASATGLTSNHHCCNALNVICKDRELPPVLGHHARHVFIEHVLLQCGDYIHRYEIERRT